jgi:GNAT superfamily N-acetyltransferase
VPRTPDVPPLDIRPAGDPDRAALPALEAAADAVFAPLGITDLPAPASAQERAAAWRVLVAGRPVSGFAVLELLDGAAHLEQLSVHPDAAGRGVGSALLAACVDEARDAGLVRMTLTTYADVPWNAPWYARRGWREVRHPSPALQAVRDRERALGLDRHGRRVVMTRLVVAPS